MDESTMLIIAICGSPCTLLILIPLAVILPPGFWKGFMASIPFLVILFIARAREEASTVLLRDLKASKRLTWTECDALRSCPLSCENSSQCKCDHDFKRRDSAEPRQRSHNTLVQLLIERRISARDYNILRACRRSGKLSWRQVAKDKIIRSFRSPNNPFKRRPAQTKVFATPELLEKILVHVPHKDLTINVPRVCKLFHEFTQTSPRLRRRLYLETDHQCSPRSPMVTKVLGKHISLHRTQSRVLDGCIGTKLVAMDIIRMREYPVLDNVYISQPPVSYVRIRIGTWRHFRNYYLGDSRRPREYVTVGQILKKLDQIFDDLAKGKESGDTEHKEDKAVLGKIYVPEQEVVIEEM